MLSEMILQNDFKPQKRNHAFFVVLKKQIFSNKLNTNKNVMVFSSKGFPEFS